MSNSAAIASGSKPIIFLSACKESEQKHVVTSSDCIYVTKFNSLCMAKQLCMAKYMYWEHIPVEKQAIPSTVHEAVGIS